MKALFELGGVVATPGALTAIQKDNTVAEFLNRHESGDWGELCDDDKRANDDAVKAGNLRILSAYKTRQGEKIWIITEADRSITTLLLPEEY